MNRSLIVGVVALSLVLVAIQPAHGQQRVAPPMSGTTVAALQGFGDRQNSTPWAMLWWHGKLYVGTDRSMACVQDATQVYQHQPGGVYPDPDPDISCTPAPQDLPLQAEIWRWTPSTNVWDRVFQSPKDVPIPGYPGKFVARDIGFRTITAFTEADGSDAMYIAGITARSFEGSTLPPPRILRSTDGQTWTPIPQDPGTFLGKTSANGFRSLTVYNGRLYVVASNGLLGPGPVYVASNPAGGNNSWQKFTTASINVFEMAAFNGFLYLGSGTAFQPFTVWKTTGIAPVTFQPVVTKGAYRQGPSDSVLSMQVFAGMLYFGTNAPAEIYRIHPDDTWDLVVGNPRTPSGASQPITALSGLGTGFNWSYNVHMWRMGTDGTKLYVGTFDQSTQDRNMGSPLYQNASFQSQLGFDLYSTADGIHFQPLTTTGFGDKFSFGARSIVSTPYGLFVGGVNPYYGLQIWLLQ